MPNELLVAALQYALLGWRVIPLHTPTEGGCSCGDPDCDHIGKHPRIKSWQTRATADERMIKRWWHDWPDANIGIATGPGSGILVVDRDRGQLPDELPAGPVVKTAKGEHYYLAHPDMALLNSVDVEGLGFDIRADGGLVVAPPSLHASGHVYDWASPPRMTLPPVPEWLLDLIAAPEPSPGLPSHSPTQGGGGAASPYAQKALTEECEKVARAPERQRNDQLNRSAFALGTLVGGGELEEESTAAALVDAGLAAGLTPQETRDTVRSGMRAGIQRPRTIAPPAPPQARALARREPDEPIRWAPHDYINQSPPWLPEKLVLSYLAEEEYGDAKMLANLYAGRLVFDHAEKQWYVWGGQSWYQDRTGLVRHLIAGQVARQYLHLAAELRPRAQTEERTEKVVEKLLARAGQLRRLSRCNNVREFATNLMGITGEEWDRDPWVLGCANGVLELRTGKLRPGRPEDYIRVASSTVWRGLDAQAPRFEQFIYEIFDGDTEIAGFMQRLLGYGITGLTVEHIFPVLWGEKGRNGKDTLLETLKRVLGDVADVVSTDVLMTQTGRGAATPHLVDLMGKRLVWASETAAGARLNEAQVKLVTGGGTIKARPMYGSMVEFTPTHLVLLITNFKPKASAEDEALWNRMVLLPFTLRFVANPKAPDERPRDTQLITKLAAERSGVLAWLVRGCLEWQQQGLAVPEKIRASTQEYRDEEDTLGQFIADQCVVSPTARVVASDLYKAYKEWAEEGGMTPLNQSNFGKRIVKRFERRRFKAAFEYMGLGLLSEGDRVIPGDPFFQKSTHEEESHEKVSQKGITRDHPITLAPPPGQGKEGAPEEGAGAGVRVVGARHSVETRIWWRSKARELLREVGQPHELGTNLDAMPTEKLIAFCEWLEQRKASGTGEAEDGTRPAEARAGD